MRSVSFQRALLCAFCLTFVFSDVAVDDGSVVLSVISPRGTVLVSADRLLDVQINIEAFAGNTAASLREDLSGWRLCYAASLVPVSRDITTAPRSNFTCKFLTEGEDLPALQLPANAGTAGVLEQWFLDAHLLHDSSGHRYARSYTRWALRVPGPTKKSAKPDQSEGEFMGGFRLRRGGLFSELQLMTLDQNTGRLPIPSGSRLWIEVGANSRNTLASVEATCPGNEDVFVLSFEPLLGQYCRLTASEKSDLNKRLGNSSDNGIVLPFAIGATDGEEDFRVSALDGCSGLLKPSSRESSIDDSEAFWNRCLATTEVRRVPTISLATLFDRLLPEGSEVDFLKVDSQGTALEVVSSAGGAHLHRIHSVLVDALIDGSPPLYVGQNTCAATVAAARHWGFHVASDAEESICVAAGDRRDTLFGGGSRATEVEMNLFFARDPLRWRPVCVPIPTTPFELKEVEDLFVLGLPNQIRHCTRADCAGFQGPSCSVDKACSFQTIAFEAHYSARSESAICFCPPPVGF